MTTYNFHMDVGFLYRSAFRSFLYVRDIEAHEEKHWTYSRFYFKKVSKENLDAVKRFVEQIREGLNQ